MRRPIVAATLAATLTGSLGGCAASACNDSEVRAFVDQAVQSRSLYAIGLDNTPLRQTALSPASDPTRIRPGVAVCSGWLLTRPVYAQGVAAGRAGASTGAGAAAHVLRTRQDFWIAKVASGFEVGLMPPLR